jgi:NADH-ubiquinone oxidoreductase chain 4
LNQIDIKKIIAYSSIAHMNFSLIGFFSQSLLGLSGAFIMMFGHAITSGALFLGIGILYDRFKTRLIYYYSGIVILMPIFSILYFLFILSNFGFPGTANFVGEFLITVGGFAFSSVILVLSTIGLILTLVYSLFFYNRIFFSSLQILFIRYYSEITRLEFLILLVFLLLVGVLGLYPNFIFNISLGSMLK